MASGPLGILGVIGLLLVGAIAIGLLVVFSIRLFGLFFRLIGHIFATIGRWIGDVFRLVGAVVVALVFIPLILLNIVIGRWSASAHFGRALTDEFRTMGACVYRLVVGHPLRLLGLRGVTEGLEQRLPNAMAQAPGPDKPSKKRQGLFEGYTIVGSLPGGGSGGKLYVAEPDELKRAAYARRGHADIDRVVIKTFSLGDGSSLPQIVRESRALDAAKKLGLVLEHELTDERFYYIMRYVPGDSLSVVTQSLHARSEPKGLDSAGIRLAVGYTTDLLEALDTYHRGGLWHKDVKPDNVIVDRTPDPALGRGKAHLVDFGLITPLRSAMTLTTHGTEYFRDPELVRQALRGVKVHQIDGGRFDVYAAGAVLFSIIENSFPAHGGLSQVSKNCPEALRWVIRRAMTDYDKRYPTARAMLDDLAVIATASDPFSVKPADLPSMNGKTPQREPEPQFSSQAPDETPGVWVGKKVQFINPRTGFKKSNVVDQHGRVWVNYKQHPVVTFEGMPCIVWESEPEVGPCILDDMRIVHHNGEWLLLGQEVDQIDSGPGNKATPLRGSQQKVEFAASASPVPPVGGPNPAAFGAAPVASVPKLRISDWWTGKYVPQEARGVRAGGPAPFTPPVVPAAVRPVTPPDRRLSAKEQRENARRRAAERRARAHGKHAPRDAHLAALGPTARAGRRAAGKAPSAINAGIVIALLFFVSAIGAGVIVFGLKQGQPDFAFVSDGANILAAPAPAAPPAPPAPPHAVVDTPAPDDRIPGMVPTPDAIDDDLDIAILVAFQPPFDPALLEDFKSVRAALDRDGVHAISTVFPSGTPDEADALLLAELLTVRGQASLDTDLGVQYNAYLAEHPDLDGVWWVGPGDAQAYRYLLVADSGVSVFESDEPALARIGAAAIDKAGLAPPESPSP